MLATLLVLTKDSDGNKIVVRALCDQGSQLNLITSDIAQALKLKRKSTEIQIKGVNGTTPTQGIIELELHSIHSDSSTNRIKAFVVPKIVGTLPQVQFDIKQWKYLEKLKLADKRFNEPSTVDILLGAAFYSEIIRNGIIKRKNAPTAQRTSFGWIIFGNLGLSSYGANVVNNIEIDNDELSGLLLKFWELEKVNEKHHRTQEEELCEQIFQNDVKRNSDGRYMVRMPLKNDASVVTNTRQIAKMRLLQMERRFERDPKLKDQYMKFMAEYEELNHMQLIPKREINCDKTIYIPHHAVKSEKFRVVFDGSAKCKNGISFNEIQMNGEKLQKDLTTTVMRFRTHKIALTADITKMYRQVLVHQDQVDMQRILWRYDKQNRSKNTDYLHKRMV